MFYFEIGKFFKNFIELIVKWLKDVKFFEEKVFSRNGFKVEEMIIFFYRMVGDIVISWVNYLYFLSFNWFIGKREISEILLCGIIVSIKLNNVFKFLRNNV